jgi:uncharacterized protein YjgD (DUF1641 family)
MKGSVTLSEIISIVPAILPINSLIGTEQTGIKATHEDGVLHPVEIIDSMQNVLTDDTTEMLLINERISYFVRNHFNCSSNITY